MSERFPPGCLINEEGQAAILSIEEREDERVKPLVLNAVAARSFLNPSAVDPFNPLNIRKAWNECKAAYDDTAFRQANRPAIVDRAKRLARRAGQTPDMMVSTEAPVPCRLEGLQLWFFNDQRLLPVWRMFEPLAIVQVREEMESEVEKR